MRREAPEFGFFGNGSGNVEASFGRRDLVVISAVILAAAAIRLVFWGGVYSPDELNYLRNAGAWWTGRFDLGNALFIHDTRPIMFVPVAWSFAALGVSESTALLWPFLASLAVVILVYLISLRLFGRETATYAAFCSVFLPLFVEEATRLLPGVVMNLLTALCVLFFINSERSAKTRWLWLLAAGMAYASIQLAGELGIVLGCFFVAAVILWRRHPLWTYWPAVCGFALVTGLITIDFWVQTGNPLFKVELGKRLVLLLKTVAPHQPLYYAKAFLLPFAAHGGVFYLAAAGCLAGLLERRREALFVALWMALTWAVIEFGSVSFSEYRQLSKEIRYLSVVSVPGVILAGYGMTRIRELAARLGAAGERLQRRRFVSAGAVLVVGCLIALMSIRTIQLERGPMAGSRSGLGRVRDEVRRYEGKPIYVTHWFWNTEVGFFMGFNREYFPSGYDPFHAVHLESADPASLNRYVQTLEPGDPMGPGLLIQDELLFEASQGGRRKTGSVGFGEIPEVLSRMPAEWRLIERVPISDRYKAALYDIPEGATWPAPGESGMR